VILLGSLFALAAIATAYLAASLAGAPASALTRDPVSVLGGEFYIGMLSHLSIMLWSASAAVSLLGFTLLRRAQKHPELGLFLLLSALVSLVLLLDDAFLFHEEVFPKFLSVPERLVPLGYVLIFLPWLWYARRVVFQTDYLLLVAAFSFLGLSFGLDLIFDFGNQGIFLEDALKFVGIVFWFVYYFRTASQIVYNKVFETTREIKTLSDNKETAHFSDRS